MVKTKKKLFNRLKMKDRSTIDNWRINIIKLILKKLYATNVLHANACQWSI